MFAPQLWNVHQVSLQGGDRTNICEAWNNGFQSLVGKHKHPSFYKVIEGFQIDHAKVMTAIVQDQHGIRMQKRVNQTTKNFNERLQNLCIDRANGRKTIVEFLTGVGNFIRVYKGK